MMANKPEEYTKFLTELNQWLVERRRQPDGTFRCDGCRRPLLSLDLEDEDFTMLPDTGRCYEGATLCQACERRIIG